MFRPNTKSHLAPRVFRVCLLTRELYEEKGILLHLQQKKQLFEPGRRWLCDFAAKCYLVHSSSTRQKQPLPPSPFPTPAPFLARSWQVLDAGYVLYHLALKHHNDIILHDFYFTKLCVSALVLLLLCVKSLSTES